MSKTASTAKAPYSIHIHHAAYFCTGTGNTYDLVLEALVDLLLVVSELLHYDRLSVQSQRPVLVELFLHNTITHHV